MLPFEKIPDDLVPLTAHFKHLLTYATKMQPLFFFLDSIDQLTGTADKVSWLPTRMPANCKVFLQETLFLAFVIKTKLIDSKGNIYFDIINIYSMVYKQIILSCANEEANPTVSKEYHLLRRLIDIDENFIEVRELGENLAMNVR